MNVTLPVYNEAGVLEASVRKLMTFLRTIQEWEFEVVIADNGSLDQTWLIAQKLARELGIQAVHLNQPGRGGTLKQVWLQSRADVLSYMDIDLSTDLSAFPALIGPIIRGDCDLSAGSRLLKESQTQRGWKREIISQCYNRLVKGLLHTRFSDAQCGFKALSRNAANQLLPEVKDNQWFMDTELLVKAERHGFRILDMPVCWVEDLDSRVKIVSTAFGDIRGLMRLRREMKTFIPRRV